MALGFCSVKLFIPRTLRICRLVNTSRNFVGEKGNVVIENDGSTSPNCSTIMGFNMSWKSTKSLNSFMTLTTGTQVSYALMRTSMKTHDDFGTSPRNSEYDASCATATALGARGVPRPHGDVLIVSVTQFTKA